jgi:tetratricopeptide (TPR) repeat protein
MSARIVAPSSTPVSPHETLPHVARAATQKLARRAAQHALALALLCTLGACSLLNIDPLPSPGRTPSAPPSQPNSAPPPESAPSAPSRPRSDASGATQQLLQQSRAARAAGNYPQATATTERALRIDPNNPSLWLELGEIALATGERKQAEMLARKALSLAADDRAVTQQAERLLRAAGTR